MRPDWHEHPAARAEFLEAVSYYLTIDAGRLASEFVQAAETAAQLVLQWPNSAPPSRALQREPPIRTWRMGKFPYSLIYMTTQHKVLVLAYAHEAREPGYWAARIEDL